MLPYFHENELDWDFDERLKIYLTCELYEVIDGDAIGYMALREDNGKIFLADLQIRKAHRNKGYGSQLLTLAKKIAKTKAYDLMYLKVFKNSPALHLYLRNGYTQVSEDEYVYLLSANI